VTQTPSFRSTITQALADTVMDESAQSVGRRRSAGGGAKLPEEGDLVGGLYRLVRLLGKGAFGRVYVAERIDVPEHQVALKVMPREMYSGRNVERELVMLAAAGHPNIVQLKDHGSTAGYVWFTTPVYDGETLAARLSRGTLSLREAHEIFVPIARGVEALHRAGLRHQDLKPENIFLAQFAGRLHPIILDLGVAAELTATFVAGTILYASPEQIRALTAETEEDRPPLGEKMDTYSLAATLLVALVGSRLFPGSNAGTYEEMAEAQRERASTPLHPDALPDLTGEPRRLLQAAFCRWFALDPAQRSSMSEMAEQLDVLLEKERAEARRERQRIAQQKANLQRARFLVAALLVLGVALLGVAWTKRETLRLAGELAQARADEAASFDKLETCVASHRITTEEVRRCREQNQRDRDDFKKTLEEMERSGSTTQASCAADVLVYTNRLRACEDEAAAARKECSAEQERLNAELSARARECETAREECRHESAAQAATMNELVAQLDQCRARHAGGGKSDDNPYIEPGGAQPAGTPLPNLPSLPAATHAGSAATPEPPPAGTPTPPVDPVPTPTTPQPPPAAPTPTGSGVSATQSLPGPRGSD